MLRSLFVCGLLIVALCGLTGNVLAQSAACSPEPKFAFPNLPTRVPLPPDLCDFVKDEAAAIRLGKAWFWDQQAGSDGLTACATCHFHAGADPRSKNQLSPKGPPESTEPGASFDLGGPNATVTPGDFPFHRLADPDDANSSVLADTNDILSSQGVYHTTFNDIIPGSATEDVNVAPDPVFHVQGIHTRRVEPRHTPSVINAIFHIETFWDGRAKFFFNGVNALGQLDKNAFILQKQEDALEGAVKPRKLQMAFASLASQAVAPTTSPFEMSAEGRNLPKIGKKLLSLTPLAKQVVHPNNSVLGPLSKDDGSLTTPGLNTTYQAMIEAAFHEKFWFSDRRFTIDKQLIGTGVPANTDEFTLMETNFSLFWGLAIMLYESTLVADDSDYDRFVAGDESALTVEEQEGMDIFFDQGACFTCHRVPELTVATVRHLIDFAEGFEQTIELMGTNRDEFGQFVYDGGFYNTGVRPTIEDIARGGIASNGEPLSWTRFAKLNGEQADGIPQPPFIRPLRQGEAERIDGSFKTPTLRNTELTGPYYHNGGQGTLLDVVEFYTRGGDFFQTNIDNVLPVLGVIGHLRGKPDRQRALAKFMGQFTDERVRFRRAPFDHPQLFVPNGHEGDQNQVANDGTGQALEVFLEIEPVGAAGSDTPLQPFLGLPPEGLQANLQPPVKDKVVVFATNSIWLRQGASITSGHVVVNQASSGPVLHADANAELSVGPGVSTPGGPYQLIANRIRWHSEPDVTGGMVSNTLLANDGRIRKQAQPLALPVSDYALPPFFQTAPPGTQHVSIDRGGKRILAAGGYGDITVHAGGALRLSGGNYNIKSLAVKRQGRVLFDDFTQVRIAGRLHTEADAVIQPSATSSEDACGLVLYVAGINGDSGHLSAKPQAAQIGINNVVQANIYAPNGTLQVQASTRATGAFMGQDVEIGAGVRLTLDSRLEFPPHAPLSRPETASSTKHHNRRAPKG